MQSSRYAPSTPTSLRTRSRENRGGQREGAGRKTRPQTSAAAEEGKRRQVQRDKENRIQQQMSEHQLQLLSNPSGRSLTEDENRILLTQILTLWQKHDHSPTSAMHLISDLSGISYATLHRLYRHWCDHSEVLIVDTSHRGAGSVKHRNHDASLSTETISTIHRFLMDSSNEGR